MRRILLVFVMAAAVMTPSVASAQQALNFSIGGFVPRGEDGRGREDVLANNLDFLAFNIKDFNGPTYGAEWLTALGNHFEAGLGVGFYSRTVPAVFPGFVNDDGTEIEQDIKLRVAPFSATVRFLPIGHNNHGIEPYIGGGVGVLAWRYSESGQFLGEQIPCAPGIAGPCHTIFEDTFVTSGSATGPLILGGIRVPVGSWGIGFEARHQSAEGKIPEEGGFSGTRIDLGGFTYNFTVHLRF